MAIIEKKINSSDPPPKELYGKSTDTKPTEGVPALSTFYEFDTKQGYIFDGTEWQQA